MRIYLIISIFLFMILACRRADTHPDFGQIAGEYKLVYLSKYNTSWPWDSVVRIYPSDNYEIKFKKLPKIMLSKNGRCEDKLKVYSCKEFRYTTSPQSHYFLMDVDRKEYSFEFPFNLAIQSFTDTLVVNGFYPFDIVNTENGDAYSCVYVKE